MEMALMHSGSLKDLEGGGVGELGLGRLWSQEVIVTDDFCAFSRSAMRRIVVRLRRRPRRSFSV